MLLQVETDDSVAPQRLTRTQTCGYDNVEIRLNMCSQKQYIQIHSVDSDLAVRRNWEFFDFYLSRNRVAAVVDSISHILGLVFGQAYRNFVEYLYLLKLSKLITNPST